MKNILIIKCGETHPEIKERFGDFEDWIIKQSNLPEAVFKIYNLPAGERLRHPGEYVAALITGSHYHINQRMPWIKHLKDWIVSARYTQLPVLGICFGHQVMASALGARVVRRTSGTNIGKATIKISEHHTGDPVFKGIGNEFETYVSHEWEVSGSVPGAEILAEDLNGSLMAFRSGKLLGIQFHPEFSEGVMKMYLKAAGLPPSSLLGVKLRSEYKNQSIVSNFIDDSLKL